MFQTTLTSENITREEIRSNEYHLVRTQKHVQTGVLADWLPAASFTNIGEGEYSEVRDNETNVLQCTIHYGKYVL